MDRCIIAAREPSPLYARRGQSGLACFTGPRPRLANIMWGCYLKIDGEILQDAILLDVEVTQELNRHWRCRVDCHEAEDKRFPVEDWLGKDLQVIVRDQDDAEHVVFDGFVLESGLEHEVFGCYMASIAGVTRSHKMDLTPRQAYYTGKTMEDLAGEFAGNAGLDAEVKWSAKPALDYVQWGETDWRFLLRLLDDSDCWIRPTASGIEISDSFKDAGTKLQWRGESGEKGLLSFKVKGRLTQPSFDGAHYHAAKMESATFSQISQEPTYYGSSGSMVDAAQRASKDKMLTGYRPTRRRADSLDGYEKILKSESERSIGSSVVASGVSKNPELAPGNEVSIDGVLDAKGSYGLTRVVHRWTPTGYVNEFSSTPWKAYREPHPAPPDEFCGFTPARVVANADPESRGRLQVQYYWQEQNQTRWARRMTPHAGSDRGFYFTPEIGDEVLVGFQEGDPERPVVLGCLWNGVDRAPVEEFWGGEHGGDDVKRIVTKSGHRIQIVDKDGKESIVIATPNELKVSMIEKTDETGRSMITLHTESGDIFVSAPNGRVHFHSKFFTREVGVASAAAAAAPSAGGEEKTSWVEIEMVDEEGNPVAGERYRVTLPDGSVVEGTLNRQGLARIDGIDPGTCQITFPSLDQEAWEKA
ncbi:MAG: phage baseplate assembly protein V [Acidobacteriota bacterium]